MKNTLLVSLITAGMLNTVNAAEVYNNDKGFSFDIEGDLQVQLRKDFEDGANLGVDFDDLELENIFNYQINDRSNVFAVLAFDSADAANGKSDAGTELSDAYIGLSYDNFTLSIGKQDYAIDDFGVEESYEMNSDSSGFDAQGDDGDDVILVQYENDYFALIASTDLESEGTDSEGGKSYDLLAITSINNLELMAGYQSQAESIDAEMVDTYGISLFYDADFATFGADYSKVENSSAIYNLASTFKATDDVEIRLGYVGVEPEDDDNFGEWYTNVTYKFPTQKNLSIFAEIGESSEEGYGLGYLAGVRLKF